MLHLHPRDVAADFPDLSRSPPASATEVDAVDWLLTPLRRWPGPWVVSGKWKAELTTHTRGEPTRRGNVLVLCGSPIASRADVVRPGAIARPNTALLASSHGAWTPSPAWRASLASSPAPSPARPRPPTSRRPRSRRPHHLTALVYICTSHLLCTAVGANAGLLTMRWPHLSFLLRCAAGPAFTTS